METMRRMAGSLLLAAALLPARALLARTAPGGANGDAVPAPSGATGTWNARAGGGARLQLTLIYESSIWGRGVARSELRGLAEGAIASGTSTPVSFALERAAGAFQMEGTFREGTGRGSFQFHPNAGFVQALRALGIEGAERPADRDLMLLALGNVSAADVRELAGLGLGSLGMDDLATLAVQGVTPDYVRFVRSLGVAGTNTAAGVAELRLQHVTPEFVRELETLGYRGLSREQLVQLGGFGVTPAFIRQARAAGFRDLTPERLVEMKISGIDPQTVRGSDHRPR
jgi:hypothetical protein